MKSNPPSPAMHGRLMIGHAKASEAIPSIIATFLIGGFYIAHQAWSTGFFTADFTILLATAFYASVFYVIVNSAAKVLIARKDVVILIELIGAVLFMGVAAWVYFVFPFNFAHLADVVPVQAQFALTWITNDIGRIIVDIALFGSIIAVIIDSARLAWARLQRATLPR